MGSRTCRCITVAANLMVNGNLLLEQHAIQGIVKIILQLLHVKETAGKCWPDRQLGSNEDFTSSLSILCFIINLTIKAGYKN